MVYLDNFMYSLTCFAGMGIKLEPSCRFEEAAFVILFLMKEEELLLLPCIKLITFVTFKYSKFCWLCPPRQASFIKSDDALTSLQGTRDFVKRMFAANIDRF